MVNCGKEACCCKLNRGKEDLKFEINFVRVMLYPCTLHT